MATYRKWAAERRVDGVIVVDLRVDDPRIPLLRKLGLPAVLVGDPALADGMPCVWTDGTAAMNAALDHVGVPRASGGRPGRRSAGVRRRVDPRPGVRRGRTGGSA